MFDDHEAGDTSVEHALGGVLGSPAVLDLLHPRLRSGQEWEVEVGEHVRTATVPSADRDRLLTAGADVLARATSASRRTARLAATVATSLAAFARHRPSTLLDRQPGERGAMSAATRAARPAALTEVSEWAVDEVALALGTTTRAAAAQLEEAVTLVERLPATLAMLSRGELTHAHARQMVAVVGPVRDDAVRAEIEAHVLRLRGDKTPPQLGDCARRIVLRKDAEAAGRRLVAAVRGRGVRMHDRRDGTASLVIDLPLPVCAAIHRTLEAHAERVRVDGDERTRQQRMADVVADLVLRPGEHGLPPVTIALTLVATLETMLGGAEPGQVDGHVVPADVVRELAWTFGLLPRPAPAVVERRDSGPPGAPPSTPTPVADRPLAEWMATAAARHETAVREASSGARQAVLDGTWTDGELRGLLDLGTLLDTTALSGTALAHRPRVAVADMLRGSLVALTDGAGLRRGASLGPPAAREAHDPPPALDRFVRLRDRRCRFPGCRARARACDLDHVRRWPDGPTAHANLCCLCEHHHRLKHQGPGWRFDVGDDGVLEVTTPGGEVRRSPVPRFGTDLDLPPF
ncbi:DUF222 domain-containing protein [Geodermatophilus sp. SYSU D00684]